MVSALEGTLREARRRFEVDFFERLLRAHNWHVPTVAKKAGIHYRYCYRKLDELGLIQTKYKEAQ